jgi:pyridoxine 4-dehydrogenase
MLTGDIKSREDIPENDMRRTYPRFTEENFPKNLELVKKLEKLAQKGGMTTAQLAIEWVRALSEKDGHPVIIPIPGATKEERVYENAKEVSLSEEDIKEIDAMLKSFEVQGGRYPENHAHLLNA